MVSGRAMVAVMAILAAAVVGIVRFSPDAAAVLGALGALALPLMAYFAAQLRAVSVKVDEIAHQTNDLAEKAQAGARAEGVIEGADAERIRGDAERPQA